MMTCKEASQLISQSYERRLTYGERLGLHIHAFICGACAQFRRQMALLHAAARHIAETPVLTPLPADARERILAGLRDHRDQP